jgi:hypothetical protein
VLAELVEQQTQTVAKALHQALLVLRLLVVVTVKVVWLVQAARVVQAVQVAVLLVVAVELVRAEQELLVKGLTVVMVLRKQQVAVAVQVLLRGMLPHKTQAQVELVRHHPLQGLRLLVEVAAVAER